MASGIHVRLSLMNTVRKVKDLVCAGSLTGELLDEYVVPGCGADCVVLVFEKHYYRAGNRLTLTAVLTGAEDGTEVHLIGGGGGEGLFRFDWGAADSFEDSVLRGLSVYRG